MSEPIIDLDLTERLHSSLKQELQSAKEQIVKLSLENSQLKSDRDELKEFLTNHVVSAHFADCDKTNIACICTVRELKMQVDSKDRENARLRESYLSDFPMGPQAEQISRLERLLRDCQEQRDFAERKLAMADRACVELETRIAELEK